LKPLIRGNFRLAQPHYFACFAMISKLSLGAAQACALFFSAANSASRSGSSLWRGQGDRLANKIAAQTPHRM
jgi:hypothetical protein